MQTVFLFLLLLSGQIVSAQTVSENYTKQVQTADSLFRLHDYNQAASVYSDAFKLNNNKGLVDDRYNAARCFALAGNKESAFYNLFRIAERAAWNKYDVLMGDTNLSSLHNDERWNKLVNKVRSNKAESEMDMERIEQK